MWKYLKTWTRNKWWHSIVSSQLNVEERSNIRLRWRDISLSSKKLRKIKVEEYREKNLGI